MVAVEHHKGGWVTCYGRSSAKLDFKEAMLNDILEWLNYLIDNTRAQVKNGHNTYSIDLNLYASHNQVWFDKLKDKAYGNYWFISDLIDLVSKLKKDCIDIVKFKEWDSVKRKEYLRKASLTVLKLLESEVDNDSNKQRVST